MTIYQILNSSVKKLKQKNIPSANLDAEVLLLEALNKTTHPQPPPGRGLSHSPLEKGKECVINKLTKTFLYSHPDYKLNQKEKKFFNDFIGRRLKREPIAYIIGHKEFFGLDFIANKNVLIPRPETEIIVEEVLKIIQTISEIPLAPFDKGGNFPQKFDLIDVGTGSGCVLISVLNCGGAKFCAPIKYKIKNNYALDISEEAIKIAKRNAEIILGKNHKIKFIAGDFSKTLDKKIFNNPRDLIITANLPYLSKSDYLKTQEEIKNFEPKIALAAPENGAGLIKKLLRKIAACRGGISRYAPADRKNIFILLEINPSQAKDISEFAKKIFSSPKIKIIKDLAGKNRVIKIEIR